MPHKCLWSDVCLPGGLGCHPVPPSFSMRSLEMPSHAPPPRLPLPFALYPPHFDQSLCLGFPAEQALDRRAMSQSGNLCSFPLSLTYVWGQGLEGGGKRMHVSARSLCLLLPRHATEKGGASADSEAKVSLVAPLGAQAAWAGLGVRQVCQPHT